MDELLEKVRIWAEEKYDRKVLAVMVLGSWASGLAKENSDYDMQVWLLPSWMDLITQKSISRQTELPELNADVTVKDIRLLIPLFIKQSPSALLILNTPYIWIEKDWKFMLDERWRSYDPKRCFSSSIAIARSTLKTADRYDLNKVLSRVWMMLDLSRFLNSHHYFPKTEELDQTGKYLKIRKGDYTDLVTLSSKSDHLTDWFDQKLKESADSCSLSEHPKNEEFLDSFVNEFESHFRKAMTQEPVKHPKIRKP